MWHSTPYNRLCVQCSYDLNTRSLAKKLSRRSFKANGKTLINVRQHTEKFRLMDNPKFFSKKKRWGKDESKADFYMSNCNLLSCMHHHKAYFLYSMNIYNNNLAGFTRVKNLCDAAICQDTHANSWGIQLENSLCDAEICKNKHADSWGIQLKKFSVWCGMCILTYCRITQRIFELYSPWVGMCILTYCRIT